MGKFWAPAPAPAPGKTQLRSAPAPGPCPSFFNFTADTRSQPEPKTYQHTLGSVDLVRVYLSIKRKYRLWFNKTVVRVDLQQRKTIVIIAKIVVIIIIMMIVLHQKVSRLLQDTMDKVLSSPLKLILFMKVRTYYIIVLIHVMLKLENFTYK